MPEVEQTQDYASVFLILSNCNFAVLKFYLAQCSVGLQGIENGSAVYDMLKPLEIHIDFQFTVISILVLRFVIIVIMTKNMVVSGF